MEICFRLILTTLTEWMKIACEKCFHGKKKRKNSNRDGKENELWVAEHGERIHLEIMQEK